MPRRPDLFSGNLFEQDRPPQGEILKPIGDGTDNLVDQEGNLYNSAGELIAKKSDPLLAKALELVREKYPNAKPSDELVQVNFRRLKAKEEEGEKSTN